MHIFLFGGTTEGRKIADCIALVNEERDMAGSYDFIETDVYVATDYGASLLPKERHIKVHVGRLDSSEMYRLFREAVFTAEDAGDDASDVLVIDATHPYAVMVTENIVDACMRAEVSCIRVHRPYGRMSSQEMLERGSSDFLYFDTVKDAAAWLKTIYSSDVGIEKNILITTGSKELNEYTVIPNFQDYCYVRALPSIDVLEKCNTLGFRRDRLILMQGPFMEDLNMAHLRYADAGFMVTKDSGAIGGFPEKCDAAIELGVRVLVIGRPSQAMVPSEDWYQVIGLNEVMDFITML